MSCEVYNLETIFFLMFLFLFTFCCFSPLSGEMCFLHLVWFGFIRCVKSFVDTLYSFMMTFSARVKLVRVGHPARLLPQVLDSALDAQVHCDNLFKH